MLSSGSYEDDIREKNPQEGANLLSKLTFWYTLKTFRKGYKRDIDEDDLTKPLDAHKSSILGSKLASLWSREVENATRHKRRPSLTKVLLKFFLPDIVLYGFIISIMELFIRINQPLFLGLMLRYYAPSNRDNPNPSSCDPKYLMRLFSYYTPQCTITKPEAYVFGTGVVVCSLLAILFLHPYMMGVMHVGMKMRIACCSLIYRKALRINIESLSGRTVGNAVNLMSNDVNRFDIVPLYYNYLWISPLQAVLITYFMWREVGYAAFIGMLALVVFIPLQIWFGTSTAILRLKTALRTDERVRQMNEIIQSIEVIKMYAWEYAFSEMIHRSRKREIAVLKYTAYIKGMIMSFIMFTTRTAIFLTIFYYVMQGNRILPEQAFMISAYYQVLRITMTVYFPQGVAQVAEAAVAIGRIRKFLLTPEANIGDPSPLDPEWRLNPAKVNRIRKVRRPSMIVAGYEAQVNIYNAWAKFGTVVCLRDVSMNVAAGQLTTIVGQVGSGKSCLLNMILGELQPFQGVFSFNGVISYASQEPWLFAGSVRQNILFGRKYERRRYNNVVKVCALERDFVLLPYGDRTIVGERGVSLSGGQRARVNLARAVYKEADIYLLDDPLSAVDTHVGKHLFEQCITGYLRQKVVILVTHQLQYLQFSKQIVVMVDGRIKARGSYAEMEKSGIDFAKLLSEATDSTLTDVPDTTNVGHILKQLSLASSLSETVIDRDNARVVKSLTSRHPQELAEMRTLGSVNSYVYKEYFRAGGNWCIISLLIFSFLLAQLLGSGGDYFLSQWVKLEEARAEHGSGASMAGWDNLSREMCVIIFSVLIVCTVVVALIRSFFFFTICMRSSVRLHDKMFDSIIRASMRFFNTNTSGRILNRFSKDLGAIDEFLPNAMIDSAQIMLNLVGVIIVVGAVQPYLLIPTLMMCILFYFMRNYYLKTSRSVKRLEGITRSPVFAHLNATLQGLTTIRSNGAEITLVEEFDKYQDIHSSSWFFFISTSRAFGYALDLICGLYMAIVTYVFLVFSAYHTGSEVGLAITQALGLTGLFQWGMRQSAELENQMTSVERVLEFTKVEHEPSLESDPQHKPPFEWPNRGLIEFKNTSLKYSKLEEPVLRNITFTIYPKEKIGIVGRTGAGKSSLIACLFRLAYIEGEVIIDGIDIRNIGLHDLRKKISIIPQEPVLFSGTMRYNLDPFNEYDDIAMFTALAVVEIQAALMYGIDCLEFSVEEGGTNLSVGERQMICLARAVLRNNVILIMDEATANMDPQTDKFIQTTIRTKFESCTVLTIAHRLHTIMDYDKVMVMDAGTVVEFDKPWVLLQMPAGILTGMVAKTGYKMAQSLRQIAKNKFDASDTK